MSNNEKDLLVLQYLKWLFENKPNIFIKFMMVFVKIVFFINQFSYELLLDEMNYLQLTDEIFEQEVELD